MRFVADTTDFGTARGLAADEARCCTSTCELEREYFREERALLPLLESMLEMIGGGSGGGGGGGGRRAVGTALRRASADAGTSCSISGEGLGVRCTRGGIRGGTRCCERESPVLGVIG